MAQGIRQCSDWFFSKACRRFVTYSLSCTQSPPDNQHLRMEHRSDPAQKGVKLIFQDGALPRAAATKPVSLAQSNHGTVKATRVAFSYIFPPNSSLNELSSLRSKWQGGVRLKSLHFSQSFAGAAPGTSSISRRDHESIPLSHLLAQRWLCSSFQRVSVLLFQAEPWQQSLQSSSVLTLGGTHL